MERHLDSDDAVLILLRGHLWVEELLVNLIRADLAIPEYWSDVDRLSFPSKLGVARAQGNLSWTSALYELNRLRNKVAHDPRFDIDLSAAQSLVRSFESDFGTIDEPHDMGTPPVGDGSSAAEVVRECVMALLGYLLNSYTDALEAKIRQCESQTRALEGLLQERREAQNANSPE